MRTGEGKTLVPTLAAVLNGLTGRGAHVVTVNDYLARRDAQWMGPVVPLPRAVGGRDHPRHVVPVRARLPDDRRAADQPAAGDPRARPTPPTSPTARTTSSASTTCATTWSTTLEGRVQRERSFAIVDEVDNILIDEARTPLIISRPGRGVGRPVLHVRPARAQAPGAARGRGGGRRLLRRPQGQGRLADRGGHRQDREAARHREPVRRRPAARPPLRLGAQGARAVQARPRLHRRGRRDRHRRRVHRAARCPAAAGARACTRRSRRRRACASSARAGPSPRSRSRTTSGCTTSWPA